MNAWALQNLLVRKDKPSLIISYIGTTNTSGTVKKGIKKKKFIRLALYTIIIVIFLAVAPRL